MSALKDRLLAAVEVTEDGCWEWQKARTTCGYAKIAVEGKTCRAHRVAYQVFVGEIPDGHHIHHVCVEAGYGTTLCINPAHLEAVTHTENTRRGNAGKHLSERTHCPRQHSYDEANTLIDETGARRCKTCRAEQSRRYRERKNAPIEERRAA